MFKQQACKFNLITVATSWRAGGGLLLLLAAVQLALATNDNMLNVQEVRQKDYYDIVDTTKLASTERRLQRPSPVVLVPGFGGSRLVARLNKTSTAHYFCDLKSDWFDIWINVKLLLPYMIDCFIDDIKLQFDYATNTTSSAPGVEIRVKNSTSLHNVEYLHSFQISGFAYMAPLVSNLLELRATSAADSSDLTFNANNNKLDDSDDGQQRTDLPAMYEREVNLIGAPYDFRKAPNELQDYFEDLLHRIEALVATSGGEKATLVCHSMGCLNMLHFLQRRSQQWKDGHIRRLVSIAAPWGGCTSALKAVARGDNLGMPFLLSESKLNQIQRTLPSTIYLFPLEKVFGDTPLITVNASAHSGGAATISSSVAAVQASFVPSFMVSSLSAFPSMLPASEDSQPHREEQPPSQEPRHYTARNLDAFFADIRHPSGLMMWLNTRRLLNDLRAPGVEVHCLAGVGYKTLARIEYSGEPRNSDSVEFFEDGDGTVSVTSGSYCKAWSDEQKQPIVYKEFEVNHIESLKSPPIVEYIGRLMQL